MDDLATTKRRETLIKAYEKKFGNIQKEPFRQYIDIDSNIKKPKKKMSHEDIENRNEIVGSALIMSWFLCVGFFGVIVILLTIILIVVSVIAVGLFTDWEI